IASGNFATSFSTAVGNAPGKFNSATIASLSNAAFFSAGFDNEAIVAELNLHEAFRLKIFVGPLEEFDSHAVAFAGAVQIFAGDKNIALDLAAFGPHEKSLPCLLHETSQMMCDGL